jgi:hypothetical protein
MKKYKLVPNAGFTCCECALYNDQKNPLCSKYAQRYPNCLKNYGKDSYMYVIVKEISPNIRIL